LPEVFFPLQNKTEYFLHQPKKRKEKLYYIILNKNNAKCIYCIEPRTKMKNKLLIEILKNNLYVLARYNI